MLYTALFSKGWVKKSNNKRDCSREETDLIKMGDVRRIGKYKNTTGVWAMAYVGGSSF